VHLCYQQGLSHSEIAAVLDWPLGTVKTNIARGKDKLRQLLAVWNPQT
jgi:RNA polymerase sigma-70 factor (ECF subfamily)